MIQRNLILFGFRLLCMQYSFVFGTFYGVRVDGVHSPTASQVYTIFLGRHSATET